MRRFVVALVAIAAATALFGSSPAAAGPPSGENVTVEFVRSAKNCDAGFLTFVGIPPDKHSAAIVAWRTNGKTVNSPGWRNLVKVEIREPGGNGPNWRFRFDAAKHHKKFPKGEFLLTATYAYITKELVYVQGSWEVRVSTCKKK